MSGKTDRNPLIRKLITALSLMGLIAIFFALYYLVYLPAEHASYNKRIFRILDEIAENCKQRINNYGIYYFYSNAYKDPPLVQSTADLAALKNSFQGNPKQIDSIASRIVQKIEQNEGTLEFKMYKNKESANEKATLPNKKGRVIDVSKPISEILSPLIAIHKHVFESVILINEKESKEATDEILYKSSNLSLEKINTDSLFKNKTYEAPTIKDIEIEGNNYKIFLLPFNLPNVYKQPLVLAGIISEHGYKQASQGIPLQQLMIIGLLLIAVLLSLPFLKIFLLSRHENISVADVRAIIAMLFIIPFFCTLLGTGMWLSRYPDNITDGVLEKLHNDISTQFIQEIKQVTKQLKEFNTIAADPSKARVDSLARQDKNSIEEMNKVKDFKDLLFYPDQYKNIEGVHWMNKNGFDIASWSFINRPSAYFNLKDRQYYIDIKENKEHYFNGNDSFTIQPTLSRLTGEYTINVAIPSNVRFAKEVPAILVDMSSKMYSVYGAVLPKGFGFSIIDDNGEILVDSDTAKNLQENFFEEASNRKVLRNAVQHRDSLMLRNLQLYNRDVKLLVKPLEGLPYSLVTYCKKRAQRFFIFHVIAFAFLCGSVLIFCITMFSYCLFLSKRKISKLFFTPDLLDWIKPSTDKTKYYKRISFYLLTCLALTLTGSLWFRGTDLYLYIINISVLLPFFVTTGYYFIRTHRESEIAETELAKNKKESNKSLLQSASEHAGENQTLRPEEESKEQVAVKSFKHKVKSVQHLLYKGKAILILYAFVIIIFIIGRNRIFYDQNSQHNAGVEVAVWSIFIIAFCAAIYCSLQKQSNDKKHYLPQFIFSVILAVLLVSILPTLGFLGYAFYSEKDLQVKSIQIDMAKKIQQKRNNINSKLNTTKLYFGDDVFGNTASVNYRKSLKFSADTGIYLYQTKLKTSSFKNSSKTPYIPFYKLVTHYLFLPPDHVEFFRNTNYYAWDVDGKSKPDSISWSLHYLNTNDNIDKESILLTTTLQKVSLFTNITHNYTGILLLLLLLIIMYGFYKLVLSVSKRVFLFGYFKKNIVKVTENWITKRVEKLKQKDLQFIRDKLSIDPTDIKDLKKFEVEQLKKHPQNEEEAILKLHLALHPLYEEIWNNCNEKEKFLLYDFSLDGFTNYKNIDILYGLFEKGLIMCENDNIVISGNSFRNFLITKSTSEDVRKLAAESRGGAWGSFRTIFYLILFGVVIFVFMAQEDASKRILTIVTSLGALIPVLLKLFDKSTFTGNKPPEKTTT